MTPLPRLFDTLVRFIRVALRTLLVVGLVVAIGAFFSGPSTTAVQTRSAFGQGFGWVRNAAIGRGVHRSGRPVDIRCTASLRVSAVALAALIFIFWGRPTAAGSS